MLTWVVLLMLAQDTGANLPARPIGPDDLVAVSVYGSPELTRNVRVSGDGRFVCRCCLARSRSRD
jgi:protein involved in polysaccharide export with SLBB domain